MLLYIAGFAGGEEVTGGQNTQHGNGGANKLKCDIIPTFLSSLHL